MKSEPSNENKFNKKTQIAKLVISILTLIAVGFYGTYLTNLSKSKELNQKYVELSISILRNKPKEGESIVIREWALDILNSYSPIKLSDSAKIELLKRPLFNRNLSTCPDGFNVYEYSITECPNCDSLKKKK